jgi:hypothetical protein
VAEVTLTVHEPFERTHTPPGAKDRLPLGVIGVPGDVSTTVAEQANPTPTVPEPGQLSVVVVDLKPTVKTIVLELLA